MKAKFIIENKKIFFQDRNGAKWSAECVDDLFMMAHLFERFLEKASYYKSERTDDKDFYLGDI